MAILQTTDRRMHGLLKGKKSYTFRGSLDFILGETKKLLLFDQCTTKDRFSKIKYFWIANEHLNFDVLFSIFFCHLTET